MRRRLRKLWRKALDGDSGAYRRLGMIFLMGPGGCRNEGLARRCLEKAAEMGDEESYLIYHSVFSKGTEVIDDLSYQEMCRDYRVETDPARKKKLGRYLRLGTERQKEIKKVMFRGE